MYNHGAGDIKTGFHCKGKNGEIPQMYGTNL